MKRLANIALIALTATTLIAAVLLYRLHSHPSLAQYESLELSSSPPQANEMRATFMGVTTILFDDGETAIVTDGFFSRPGPWQSISGKIAPDRARIDSALNRAGIHRLAAVLVAHSHYEHVMDSPIVAERTGAILVGSESTANVARGEGLREDFIQVIKGSEPFIFGRFKVTPYKSPHSPRALFRGEITAPLESPARMGAYRDGGNYSYLIEHDGRTILFHPSANFSPGMYKGVHADVVFLGIGTLGKLSDQFARDYWREVVQTTGARLVVPIHWDDFMTPLDQPLRPMPLLLDDFDRGMELIGAQAEKDHVAVKLMPVFEPVDVLAVAR
jgi:L-ascorbate metabolism protein UlaG (beta-lactamase superfamily)